MKAVRLFPLAIAIACTLIAPGICCANLQQASQPQTLADLAKQVRAERELQPQPKVIWTNDNVPKSGGVSIVGPAREPQPETASESTGETKTAEAPTNLADKGSAQSQLSDELATAKQNLASMQIDLDIAQKQFALDQSMFDSNPGRPTDFDGAAKLKREARELQEKQAQVADAEQRVARLEAQLQTATPATK